MLKKELSLQWKKIYAYEIRKKIIFLNKIYNVSHCRIFGYQKFSESTHQGIKDRPEKVFEMKFEIFPANAFGNGGQMFAHRLEEHEVGGVVL